MYVGQEAISLKFSVSKAGNYRKLWPDQRRSICPTTTSIHYSPPSKKTTPKTTRCFVDDDHEVDKNDSYGGMSVHPRLIAVTAPSTPSALTRGDRYGSSGVLSIERPKMDMSQKSPSRRSTASPSVDDGGGSRKDGDDGGNIGGGSGNGGSGGVNDDDKYRFDDDDNDDDGDGCWLFGKRVLVEEIFDGITMNAVLSEWKQTMKDLPMGLRRACEMGLLSTAEITKFFWFNTRPTLSRQFVRLLPQGLSMDFYAKIMSDPALPWKLLFEAVSSVGWSLWLESTHGSDERKWDLMIANAATNAAFNTFLVFSLAPSSEFTRLRNLPNNVFEKSQRFHEFDMQKRAVSFFRKAISLFALGFAAKSAAQIWLLIKSRTITTDDNDHDHDRKIKKILKITSESCKEALAAGLSLGFLTNLRHQLIWGIDRRLDLHFDVKKVSLAFCLALRFLNVGIGARSLNYWNVSDDHEVNHRMVRNIEDYSWLGLKNIILTSNKTQSTAPAKRKRVVKNKVRANLC